MKTLFLTVCIVGLMNGLQAKDSTKNSIGIKVGNANNGGLYFSTSYSRHFSSWFSVSPSFIYSNMLLNNEISIITDGSGIVGEPTYINDRLSSAFVLDVHFSSLAFTSPDCKHIFLLGLGVGGAQYIKIHTQYAWSDNIPPYYTYTSTKVNSLLFCQHASLGYYYKLGKCSKLGVFGDFLKTKEDSDWGIGLSYSVSF